MIALDRTRSSAPPALVTDGAAQLPALQALVQAGTLRAKHFDASIYGSKDVRKELHAMQDGKCCYCEKLIERAYSDVEHFRPKARVTVKMPGGGSRRVRLGYWWLGYEFENLLLSCANCNRNKSDQFAITAGHAALAYPELPWKKAEQQMLIDPRRDDPTKHITFVFDAAQGMLPAPLTVRGRTTIRTLALDRDDLVEMRGKHYQNVIAPLLQRWKDATDEATRATIEAEATVHAARAAPFSAMASQAFRLATII